MPVERWLITGASGQLGSHVVRLLSRDDVRAAILALTGRQDRGTSGVPAQAIDLADHTALHACAMAFRPTHVVHLGAMTAVGECLTRPEDAERINTGATRVLSKASAAVGARLVFSSTDMVFDGDHAPYVETDQPHPLSHYGRTKVAAERTLAGLAHTLVVRIPLLYGLPCNGRETTFTSQLAALRSGQPLRLFTDEFRTPVWLADSARALIALARSDLTGIIHLAGPQRLSRYELVAQCARLLGVDRPNLAPISRLAAAAAEPRPADLSLDGRRCAALLPHLAPGPLRAAVFSPC
jgi:dTDP-4-dehydrorhamnose reductase